ncbi:MAG: ATP phosphoribosyltransferase regulatory subunit [Phycisphaerales bacterium]
MTKPTSSPVSSPKGTRDLYPDQMLRQNYITRLWRDTAIRHGFEEINGPTFEMLELYTRKSGEGIVSELFRFRREGGEDDYALRPEFTPTLARMYAAKAASLPSPTKWFSIGPYFRAEKPQRGRLREFLQWNVDVLGGDEVDSDFDALACIATLLQTIGLRENDSRIRVSDRRHMSRALVNSGVSTEDLEQALVLLDRKDKIPCSEFRTSAIELGINESVVEALIDGRPIMDIEDYRLMGRTLNAGFRSGWFVHDSSIVRGLAYYTGTVFEVIAEGERAIAGGGRYDNLIELFGGPPTPAVGFGMGDVVLGLLLDDKGLMPQGADLLDALSRPGASLRPEAFVVAGSEDEDALVEPLLANLRRGIERDGFDGRPWAADRYAVRPMHARRTYKTTRNLKKLISDAEKQHAKFAVVLHGPDKVQVKDLDRREELVHDQRGDFSVNPASGAYVGQAIAARLGH